jgi:hypothetical protein
MNERPMSLTEVEQVLTAAGYDLNKVRWSPETLDLAARLAGREISDPLNRQHPLDVVQEEGRSQG